MADYPFQKISYSTLVFLPASHEDSKDPGSLKKVLFRAKDISQGVKVQMINWSRLRKNRSFNAHYHEDMDEIFIIISGSARLTVEGKSVNMKKGDSVYIPMGKVHVMKNTAKGVTDYLALGLSMGQGGRSVNV